MSTSQNLLQSLHSPKDVKALTRPELNLLAQDIRDEIISVTSTQGGHVGPNLGVVELSIALHRVFSTPTDKFVFDVSHQGYTHKLLTGRNGAFFKGLRQTGGTSGFLMRSESEHDSYGAGHAGTALSAALGMASARDLKGTSEHVVAICGDAAFTCGITMEALNNVVSSTKRLIVILNDNEWSIAKNVGAIAHYLNRLSTSTTYNKIHSDLEKFFLGLPNGHEMNQMWNKWKRETKDFFMSSSLFEKFGLRYIGPIDGHNLDELIKHLEFAKSSDSPIILHVITKKGHGLPAARNFPEKFHGLGAFDPESGESKKSPIGTPQAYQDVLGQALLKEAKLNSKIVGITAAMPSGTGLTALAKELPKQFFDVGIAEEHAVLFAAGLATQGYRPVCAIYSTFLQRAYDPIVHDVALQNLPVTFCMDRAGLSPNDGATHHGLFDISYLRCVPRAVVMQPKDEDELCDMLHTSLSLQGPGFIRYPRGAAVGKAIKATPELIEVGKAELLKPGNQIFIWALGPMLEEANKVAQKLESTFSIQVGIVNPRFIKPIDTTLLLSQAKTASLLVTMEDHVLAGGFGSSVLEILQDNNSATSVERIGWPDQFVEHGSSVSILRSAYGLSSEAIFEKIASRYKSVSSK
ncbi:MAG: 1-deoxy-D-xylulose-5-phosphate synthase [Verrucomicrobiota bacterium]|jgi:1-deoxy-D-xylulose-5-phosphate synthase